MPQESLMSLRAQALTSVIRHDREQGSATLRSVCCLSYYFRNGFAERSLAGGRRGDVEERDLLRGQGALPEERPHLVASGRESRRGDGGDVGDAASLVGRGQIGGGSPHHRPVEQQLQGQLR